MMECPQCNRLVDSLEFRLVQDSCGHMKCRGCLLSDSNSCSMCHNQEHNETSEGVNLTTMGRESEGMNLSVKGTLGEL